MALKTGLYTNDDCLKHDPGKTHPEKPLRLMRVLEEMRKAYPDTANAKYEWVNAPAATPAHILLGHDAAYWARVQAVAATTTTDGEPVALDEDTRMSGGSLAAALYGVGGACAAVDDMLAGRFKNTFILTRPPGHHALKNNSMGFCIFGTIAIAAKYALTKPGIKKVAIVDFDVHHGNGTEDIVQDDPRVLFFSLHQQDIWPYQHHENHGPHGTINNLGFPGECDPALWHDAFDKIIMPKIHAFKPDMIFISAGFDAHRDDPPGKQLFNDAPGRQKLLETDFSLMTRKMMAAAPYTLSVLEGGYSPDILARCAVDHAKTLMGN